MDQAENKLSELYSKKIVTEHKEKPKIIDVTDFMLDLQKIDDPGYHLVKIQKGVFGEFSKIEEEVAELKDSLIQNSPIMALVELSDLIGAIDGFLKKYHPTITVEDLIVQSKITQRAFENGHR